MDLSVTVAPNDHVRVFVNGALACEVSAGMTDARDALEAEVARARCARAGMAILLRSLERLGTIQNREDHVNTSSDSKRAAYMRGLVDGASGSVVRRDGHDGLFDTQPDYSPSYSEGYEYGQSITRAAKGATSQE